MPTLSTTKVVTSVTAGEGEITLLEPRRTPRKNLPIDALAELHRAAELDPGQARYAYVYAGVRGRDDVMTVGIAAVAVGR